MDYYGLIIGFIAGACGSLILWVTIGRRMMLKYAGESVINAFKEPSDDLKLAINALMTEIWIWLNEASIEVPGPPKEDGSETKVHISPLQNVLGAMIDDVVNRMSRKLFGQAGGRTKEANEAMRSMGIPLPRKGQTTQEFLMEQLANRVMPKIEEVVNSKLENIGKGKKPDEQQKGW